MKIVFFLALLLTVLETAAQPNVVFFFYDDLRPEMGTYGSPEALTPNLDALAAEAVRFDRAYVNSPLCNPARAGMMTGLRFDGRTDGLGGGNSSHTEKMQLQSTLPRVLKEAGYWMASRGKVYHGTVPGPEVTAWHISGTKEEDIYADFSSLVDDEGGRADHLSDYTDGTDETGSAALVYVSVDGPDNTLADGRTADDVIDYITNQRDTSKPFAVACGFVRPHLPWVAPKQYFDMYAPTAGALADIPTGYPTDGEGVPILQTEDAVLTGARNGSWNEGVDDVTAQKLIRGYMATTTYADAQMGRVINTLKSEGLYDNTIIIVWGDHGYHLTDHGLWRKNTAYNVSMRCPLMIRVPGVNENTVVSNLVQNIDVYPTVLDLLGIDQPNDVEFHGVSLKPLIEGTATGWTDERFCSSAYGYSLITSQYRYTDAHDTRPGPTTFLYDLNADPEEWNNLADDPSYAALIAGYQSKLDAEFWSRRFDPDVGGFDVVPTPTSSTALTMTSRVWDTGVGAIEYLFTETSGNAGGSSSSWQSSTTFAPTGLLPETTYTYTVTMKDANATVSQPSRPLSVTMPGYSTTDTAPLLLGWHSPNEDKALITPDTSTVTNVTATFTGGAQVKTTDNSVETVATYGSIAIPGNPTTSNAFRLQTSSASKSRLDITITNNSGGDLMMGSLLFDYGRNYPDSPKDLSVIYLNGDLADADNTVVYSFANNAFDLTNPSNDYYDVDIDLLSTMSDTTLADTESATFRFVAANAVSTFVGLSIDNIAFRGVPPGDTDGDGVPDATESAWGLDPADNTDASSDADGDGQNALEEFVQGTNATSHNNKPDVTLSSPSASQWDMSFQTVETGRIYVLEQSTDLSNWSAVDSHTSTTSDAFQFNQTNSDAKGFYRIRVYPTQ
jgi:uncharacterized sulfatase